jgi:hypothetical protein
MACRLMWIRHAGFSGFAAQVAWHNRTCRPCAVALAFGAGLGPGVVFAILWWLF